MDGVDGRRGLGGLPELVRNLLQPALEVEGPAALHKVLDVVQYLQQPPVRTPTKPQFWAQHSAGGMPISTQQRAADVDHAKPHCGDPRWWKSERRNGNTFGAKLLGDAPFDESFDESFVPGSRC